jgi:peptide/nickel transport system permease protein
MIRAGVINALRSPYAEMALLKGLPRRRRLVSHVLPNAIVPGVHAFALTAASMPAGVVVVEYLFGFQGVGVLLIDSVRARDTPTVQSLTLILVAFYLFANAVSDAATTLLTPRLRVR